MDKKKDKDLAVEGYDRALELIHNCSTADNFVASPSDHDNYRRIWARDGVILGLAALMTGDQELVETFRRTLFTLAAHQGCPRRDPQQRRHRLRPD